MPRATPAQLVAVALTEGHEPRVIGNAGTLHLSNKRLTNRDNSLTKAGAAYEAQQGTTLTAFQPGVFEEGGRSYATRINGQRVLVRYRTQGGGTVITKAGRQYFATHATEFLVNIPVVHWWRNVTKNGVKWHRTHDNETLPLDDQTIQDLAQTHGVDLSDLNRARGSGDADQKIAVLRTTIEQLLNTLPKIWGKFQHPKLVEEAGGETIINLGSSEIFAWDRDRPLLISERSTHLLERSTVPRIEVILNRPMLGVAAPDLLLDMDGVCKEAWTQTGDCVVRQLLVCVERRSSKRTATGTKSYWRPYWEPKDLELRLNGAFEKVHTAGEYPFELGNWRTVGVTCAMLIHIAQEEHMVVSVVHNYELIYKFQPEGWKPSSHTPAIVLTVNGDHAFMYRREAANQISRRSTCKALLFEEPLSLATDPPKVPYAEMRPWDFEAVEGNFYMDNLEDAADKLRELHISFRATHGNDPWRPSSLVLDKGKIRRVPPEADVLARWCESFSEKTGLPLTYYGESVSILTHWAVGALVKQRRHPVPDSVHKTLLSSQKGRCAICDDPLKNTEVDHVLPIKFGGTKLQLLCGTCHAAKTQAEEAGATPFRDLESTLHPDLHNLFCAPGAKPKQFSGYLGESAPEINSDVRAFDVCGCRRNAIAQSSRLLPVFCVADVPVGLPRGYKPGYD